jgi:hypothetical protein
VISDGQVRVAGQRVRDHIFIPGNPLIDQLKFSFQLEIAKPARDFEVSWALN